MTVKVARSPSSSAGNGDISENISTAWKWLYQSLWDRLLSKENATIVGSPLADTGRHT